MWYITPDHCRHWRSQAESEVYYFPEAVKIYADTYFKTSDDVVIPYKMIAYKASPQLNFEIAFSNTGDPASITITCDLLVDDDDNMLDMIFEDGEESA